MTKLDELRNEEGKLPAYAWPGGYPLVYLFADAEPCCPACANGENGSLAATSQPDDEKDPQWLLRAVYVHWEGSPEVCSNCHKAVSSAYGDPDDQAEEEEDWPRDQDEIDALRGYTDQEAYDHENPTPLDPPPWETEK